LRKEIRMKKIIVGYDGSNTGRAALVLAKEHAQAFDGSIYVVASLIGGDDTHVDDIKHAEDNLAYAQTFFEQDDIPCETHLLIRGLNPGEDIVQFAKDISADQIVVGVRRRSKVGKLMFGSTAQLVILEAPCPVVTVK
jgi:nucleotide-binding universal stress UspA family protein